MSGLNEDQMRLALRIDEEISALRGGHIEIHVCASDWPSFDVDSDVRLTLWSYPVVADLETPGEWRISAAGSAVPTHPQKEHKNGR